MKILAIAWKNIWRNKLRSLIVITAITIGIMSGTFSVAVMLGMVGQRVDDAINIEAGHIQIHNPKFDQNEDVKYTIKDYNKIIQDIEANPKVSSAYARNKTMAFIKSPKASSGGFISGIDTAKDKQIEIIQNFLIDSTKEGFANEKASRKPILISRETAKSLKLEKYELDSISKLKLKKILPEKTFTKIDTLAFFRNKIEFIEYLNSKLTEKELTKHKKNILNASMRFYLSSRTKISYSIVSKNINVSTGIFRVAGVYKTNNRMFDAVNSFCIDKDISKILEIEPNETHEIVIMLHNLEDVEAFTKELQDKYPELKIENWKTLKPDAGMSADMMGVYGIVFMTIILLALAFGIINTMLMVVLERVKEIGMLMAIGMNKLKVFSMIMFETILLCLVGAIIGMAAGYGIIQGTIDGIDISAFGDGMEAMGYASMLYPQLDPVFFIEVTILTIITGIIAAIYPARKAIKLNPAEAVRSDV